MNIFWLSKKPKKAAELACDQHVVKMVTEYAQVLWTVMRVHLGTPSKDGRHLLLPGEIYRDGQFIVQRGFRATHRNHPVVVWASKRQANFDKLCLMLEALAQEFSYRFGKPHASYTKFVEGRKGLPRNFLPTTASGKISKPPQAMPMMYRAPNVVLAYKRFYAYDKQSFAKWTKRKRPEWMFSSTEFDWRYGQLKMDTMGLSAGRVYFRRNEIRHTSIGPTYWVTDGHTLVHISEDLGGRRLRSLIREESEREVNVVKIEARLAELLSTSVYAPAQRDKNTYLYKQMRP